MIIFLRLALNQANKSIISKLFKIETKRKRSKLCKVWSKEQYKRSQKKWIFFFFLMKRNELFIVWIKKKIETLTSAEISWIFFDEGIQSKQILLPSFHECPIFWKPPFINPHVLHPIPACCAFLMSCTSPVVHSSCTAPILSYIPHVLHPTCHVHVHS